MSYNFGERIPVSSWGRGVQLSADGFPKAKAGGVQFNWASVTALANDTYMPDQLDQDGNLTPAAKPILKGSKVVRYGTPIERQADGTFSLAQGAGAKGDVYYVNETAVLAPGATHADREPIAIDGGRVFKARILSSTAADEAAGISGNVVGKSVAGFNTDGSASVAADVTYAGLPTLAQLEAALPSISYALD
jgi:hypothetical protein